MPKEKRPSVHKLQPAGWVINTIGLQKLSDMLGITTNAIRHWAKPWRVGGLDGAVPAEYHERLRPLLQGKPEPAEARLWRGYRGENLRNVLRNSTVTVAAANGFTGYKGGAWWVGRLASESASAETRRLQAELCKLALQMHIAPRAKQPEVAEYKKLMDEAMGHLIQVLLTNCTIEEEEEAHGL